MSTDEKQTTPAIPADDAERRTWFAAFGYTGDLDEPVTLRSATGELLGTATVAEVWAVQRGLVALKHEYSGQFHRVGNWAEAARRPLDVTNRLSEPEYGPLTVLQSGDWLPNRREIVCCLLERRPDDDVIFRFREHPLVQREEVARAA